MSADRTAATGAGRVSIAARLAAGMLANPETYRMQSFEAYVAGAALRIADRILAKHAADLADAEQGGQ